ncbi:MAG: ABC transporter permease [Candidatus Roizmanbacteria bacterium]|nr:ABC transporter permease [Candidatus Roizmanbacteria bacterium]
MEYRENLHSAYQSLKSSKLRTVLTMLGIIIGISAVILIVSIGQGAVQYITDELSAFGTNFFSINPGTSAASQFAGGKKNLTLEDMEAIQRDSSLTNIEYVIPFAAASVTVSANNIDKTLLVYGTTHEASQMLSSNMIAGEFLSEEDVVSSSRVAVVGSEAAEEYFGEDTYPIGEIIRIDNKPFRVIGISKASSGFFGGFFNNAVFIPVDVVMNQIIGTDAGLQEIDISVHDTELINQTIEDVSVLLRDRHTIDEGEDDDFVVQSFQDALSTVQTITTMLTLVVAAISGISLVVGGVGVMNIMLVTVTERTREIGLLKSIGAKQRDILNQFLMEAVVLTLTGGIIGITLGIGGAFLISLILPIPFVVSVPAIAIAVGVSISVGIIFGIYPARRAAKLNPIDALRHE